MDRFTRFPAFAMSDPEGVIRCIRRTIHNLELHEADEMILVGGQRIFDPHL